jgi:hypothetical protein
MDKPLATVIRGIKKERRYTIIAKLGKVMSIQIVQMLKEQ